MSNIYIVLGYVILLVLYQLRLLWPPAMLAAGHSVLLLSFRAFFFSPTNVRGRLANRHQTLPHVRW